MKYTKVNFDYPLLNIPGYNINQLVLTNKHLPGINLAKLVDRYNNNERSGNSNEKELQILIWGIKRSKIPGIDFDPNNFVILVKDGRKFDVSLSKDGKSIILSDFILLDTKENKPVKISPNTKLYHTSHIGGISKLVSSYGGIKNHSAYSNPRIYVSTIPTTGGGIPLIFGPSADNFAQTLVDKYATNKDWVIKYLCKWIAALNDRYVYVLQKHPNKVYNDIEIYNPITQSYYIENVDSIPVKQLDNKITLEDIYNKYRNIGLDKVIDDIGIPRIIKEVKLRSKKTKPTKIVKSPQYRRMLYR